MSWIRAVRDAGPLLGAAERFLARERDAGEPPLPRGASALAWLARRVDRFAEREDATARDESAFVEGAGALLALVLLDHVGEGGHASRDGAHRVRVGARGFFDPFAAIEAALDAPAARDVLIAEVARAEREARGEDGVGRAALVFERLLETKRPDLAVRDRFDRRLWLEGDVEVDLARTIDASEGQGPAAVEQAVAKLVSMLPGGEGTTVDRDEAAARLLPRVVAPELAADVSAALFSRVLPNDVRLSLVLAYEGRSRFVRGRELEGWGLGEDDAIRLALENLAARSANARFARVETAEGAMVIARTGDGLDSARLLLPTLHDVLAPELGSPFLAAIPHRDALYAATPSARAALATRATDDAARAPHRITSALFLVTAQGLRHSP
ncbi:hypothetical protein [Sandaracinus amylolyticus]|uniref:hypothetical protein n=1 Tax=Sandaracinus amylolyticus TaxID=927083 RepID=UPI001F1C2321|nr:hypothetical protein [Sandaracinus amylolyticus]UJR80085.1 Hypothetical protein I5071_21290 [Sandaracinus amylolyticus]